VRGGDRPAPERERAAQDAGREDGVDRTLVRWLLSLGPAERLAILRRHVDAVEELRGRVRAMDFRCILADLAAAQVELVVVGGVCAVLHGEPATTSDLDVVHARDEQSRLTQREGDLATEGHRLLMTRAGPLDLQGAIGGGRGFEDLVAHSARLDLGEGLQVRPLGLERSIELKEESRRGKDRARLPLLRRTLAERRGRGAR